MNKYTLKVRKMKLIYMCRKNISADSSRVFLKAIGHYRPFLSLDHYGGKISITKNLP